jgi:glycosyltransferase involved in cell wall biosynthesis
MKTKFLIIATGWNCQEFVSKCVESVRKQRYEGEVTAVFISDGSTDDTAKNIQKSISGLPNDFHAMISDVNCGAACRRHKAIEQFKPDPETAIMFLGLDDELLPGALGRIDNEYNRGKWMTYGNWKDQHGKGLPVEFKLTFPKEVHENRSYREVMYRSTAPNTFLAKLYYKIPATDLMIDGSWIQTCTEGEIMYSCLEMCGKDRIGIIRDYIYLYNRMRPSGSQRRFGKVKREVLDIIASRPKRPLYEDIA